MAFSRGSRRLLMVVMSMSEAEGTAASVDRVDALSRQLNDLRDRFEDVTEAQQERIAELEAEKDRLQQRVTELEERTELQRHVRDASSLRVDERAAVCIQTLVNQARRRERSGDAPAAAMDYRGADDALGGGLDDRQLYNAIERAAELVDGDVVRFKKEPRSSQKNSRLVVDLDQGSLPDAVAGREINGGRGDV